MRVLFFFAVVMFSFGAAVSARAVRVLPGFDQMRNDKPLVRKIQDVVEGNVTLEADVKDTLVQLAKNLSGGELSTLAKSLAEPGSLIGTSRNGQTHYPFLKALTEAGLANEVPLAGGLDLPEAVRASIVSFSIVPEHRKAVLDILLIARPDLEAALHQDSGL